MAYVDNYVMPFQVKESEAMESVLLRFYGAAKEAAGVSEVEVSPATLGQILASVSEHNLHLRQVLSRCSFLIDGVNCQDFEVGILAGSTVDLLPPFAGG